MLTCVETVALGADVDAALRLMSPCMCGRRARQSPACSAGELWVWSVQVYKSHLVEGRQPAGPAVDSARQNLAATFVNAFVNAGFGQDKLVTGEV